MGKAADEYVAANVLGELLRAWAFIGKGCGCYSNFDVRPEFARADVTPREFAFLWGRYYRPDDIVPSDWGYCDGDAISEIAWFKHPSGIEMGWHWDGDGCLGFFIPQANIVLRNGDCKKDHEWEFGSTNSAGK
jgi:hypothetical protein